VKNFNERFKKLMEDMSGATPGTTTAAGIGSTGAANGVPVGQSSDNIYAPGDARNLFGQPFKSKKSKFKAPKFNTGFKSKFKVIRRTPVSI
jgi:hypothetical protein